MTSKINQYITKRYYRWLDYARYHASLVKLSDQAEDILHEVLVSLINKDPDKLQELFNNKKDQYTELDFYVLKMIKLNAYSPTAPFRHVYLKDKIDRNVNPWSLDLPDEPYDFAPTFRERALQKLRLLRIAFDWTFLSPEERNVCEMIYLGDTQITEAAQTLGITYTRAREVRVQGTQKIRSTLQDIMQLRKN
ncbi:hypothetical protein ACFLTA_02495 [Bacteroidota bacterium]